MRLTLPLRITSRLIMQKARGQAFRTEVRHSPPTACRHTVSGTISLPSQGFFSPFPHGTGSLSVARKYLALRDGPRRFPRDFTCPAVLRYLSRAGMDVVYGAVTLSGRSFQIVRLSSWFVTRRFYTGQALQPHRASTMVWAVPRSLAATSGITVVFSSCGY